MDASVEQISAIVLAGYGVASGCGAEDKRFPDGTIRMQTPFFKERGLDLELYFGGNFVYGTLNLSIEPRTFSIVKPQFFIENVKWTDIFPPENFFLGPARIIKGGKEYNALFYIPDPATKPDHFQPPSVIEIIAEKIPDIFVGDRVVLCLNKSEIAVSEAV